MVFAVITTTVWYLGGDPLGIDNIYIVEVTPLIVMLFDHFINKNNRVSHKETKVIKTEII